MNLCLILAMLKPVIYLLKMLTTFCTFPLAAVAADRAVLLRAAVPDGAKLSVDCFALPAAVFPLAGAFFCTD